MYHLKQLLGDVPRKKALLEFGNMKGDEWYINDEKNIQKLHQIMQTLLNPWEILVKTCFLLKFQPYKCNKNKVSHKYFACFLGTANLRNNSFLFTGKDHIHSMPNSLSQTLCSKLSLVYFGKDVIRKIAVLNVWTKSRKWQMKDSLLSKVTWSALSCNLKSFIFLWNIVCFLASAIVLMSI